MCSDKNFTVNINARVAVGAALGVGLVAGAGTVYLMSRLNEHTRLTHQISSLHATIMEVKKDIRLLETGLTIKDGEWEKEGLDQLQDHDKSFSGGTSTSSRASSRPSSRSSVRKKTVSFSSTASTSYNTATEYDTDGSFVTAAGYDTDSRNTDTDYYSPDEDDDEFFDLTPEDSVPLIYLGVNMQGDDGKATGNEDSICLTVGTEEHLKQLLKQVDILCEGNSQNQTQAFHLLRKHSQHYKDSADFHWRLAMTTRYMAAIAEKSCNLKEKEALIFEAFSYAERALELEPENADVHKWYGILVGMRGEYLGIGERVRSGIEFKEHIDKALALRPQDSTLHHLLGRFCYETSQLTWLERKATATLFGEVPQSTFAEAFRHFEAAENLRPREWKENRLFLAKCQIQLGNIDLAVMWLKRAKEAQIKNADDEIVQQEVLKLLEKYS